MINNKKWDEITNSTKVCKCGHRILFKKSTRRVICTWCGNWCYKNRIDEFKDKLKKEGLKINEKKNQR